MFLTILHPGNARESGRVQDAAQANAEALSRSSGVSMRRDRTKKAKDDEDDIGIHDQPLTINFPINKASKQEKSAMASNRMSDDLQPSQRWPHDVT